MECTRSDLEKEFVEDLILCSASPAALENALSEKYPSALQADG